MQMVHCDKCVDVSTNIENRVKVAKSLVIFNDLDPPLGKLGHSPLTLTFRHIQHYIQSHLRSAKPLIYNSPPAYVLLDPLTATA